jgi:anti-sigma factor RsiW
VRLPNPANITIGISVFICLAVIVILILAFAHAGALQATPDLSKRCFETFGTAQWPKWIGCAMAAHETLAAGLVGAAGALFAAWLAYSAVQRQLAQHAGVLNGFLASPSPPGEKATACED